MNYQQLYNFANPFAGGCGTCYSSGSYQDNATGGAKTKRKTPVKRKTSVKRKIPVRRKTSVKRKILVKRKTPVKRKTLVKRKTSVKRKTPVKRKTTSQKIQVKRVAFKKKLNNSKNYLHLVNKNKKCILTEPIIYHYNLKREHKYFPNIKVIERTFYRQNNKNGGFNGVPDMPTDKLELLKAYIGQINSLIPIKNS